MLETFPHSNWALRNVSSKDYGTNSNKVQDLRESDILKDENFACSFQCRLSCILCQEAIAVEDIFVRLGSFSCHEKCLTCFVCSVDLLHKKSFKLERRVICQSCLNSLTTCFSCKKEIYTSKFWVEHHSRGYHLNHFRCNFSGCKMQLQYEDGFFEQDNKVFCLQHCPTGIYCRVCGYLIFGDAIILESERGKTSHVHSQCFMCALCNRSISWDFVYDKGMRPVCTHHILLLKRQEFKACRNLIDGVPCDWINDSDKRVYCSKPKKVGVVGKALDKIRGKNAATSSDDYLDSQNNPKKKKKDVTDKCSLAKFDPCDCDNYKQLISSHENNVEQNSNTANDSNLKLLSSNTNDNASSAERMPASSSDVLVSRNTRSYSGDYDGCSYNSTVLIYEGSISLPSLNSCNSSTTYDQLTVDLPMLSTSKESAKITHISSVSKQEQSHVSVSDVIGSQFELTTLPPVNNFNSPSQLYSNNDHNSSVSLNGSENNILSRSFLSSTCETELQNIKHSSTDEFICHSNILSDSKVTPEMCKHAKSSLTCGNVTHQRFDSIESERYKNKRTHMFRIQESSHLYSSVLRSDVTRYMGEYCVRYLDVRDYDKAIFTTIGELFATLSIFYYQSEMHKARSQNNECLSWKSTSTNRSVIDEISCNTMVFTSVDSEVVFLSDFDSYMCDNNNEKSLFADADTTLHQINSDSVLEHLESLVMKNNLPLSVTHNQVLEEVHPYIKLVDNTCVSVNHSIDVLDVSHVDRSVSLSFCSSESVFNIRQLQLLSSVGTIDVYSVQEDSSSNSLYSVSCEESIAVTEKTTLNHYEMENISNQISCSTYSELHSNFNNCRNSNQQRRNRPKRKKLIVDELSRRKVKCEKTDQCHKKPSFLRHVFNSFKKLQD